MKQKILLLIQITIVVIFHAGCDDSNQNFSDQIKDIDIRKHILDSGIKLYKHDVAIFNERIELVKKYNIPMKSLKLDNQLAVNNMILMDQLAFENMLITIKYSKMYQDQSEDISNYWLPKIETANGEAMKMDYIYQHKKALDSLQNVIFKEMENAKTKIGG